MRSMKFVFWGVLCAAVFLCAPIQNEAFGQENTAHIIFQSMCSGGGDKGILDADFPVKISWRCSKCGRKTEVTVPLVKADNTTSIAQKIASAVNRAVAGSSNVKVKYYQTSPTKKQSANWYRISFEGVDQVDAGAWHSKLKIYVLTGEGTRTVHPGPLPEGVTPGKPGRKCKPGKEVKKDKKKKKWLDPEYWGWKEVKFHVSLVPWPGSVIEVGQTNYSYSIPFYESEPEEVIFDRMEAALAADGFEVLRLDDEHLAILSGPENTIVANLMLGTTVIDTDHLDIEQEEHWYVGDVVSNFDLTGDPEPLNPDDAAMLHDAYLTAVNAFLAQIAADIDIRAGYDPMEEYPFLLANELWEPDPYDPECPDIQEPSE